MYVVTKPNVALPKIDRFCVSLLYKMPVNTSHLH